MIRATSHAAAKSIAPFAGTLKARVFAHIASTEADGATLHEIAEATRISLQTVCARRKELEEKGLVVASGRTRPSPSGRQAMVWIIPERVRTYLAHRLKERGL